MSEDFRAWLKTFNSLTAILKRRGDKASVKTLLEQRDRLREMLATLGVGTGSKKHGTKRKFSFLFFAW
jgi:chorismate-pyruvate lyase